MRRLGGRLGAWAISWLEKKLEGPLTMVGRSQIRIRLIHKKKEKNNNNSNNYCNNCRNNTVSWSKAEEISLDLRRVIRLAPFQVYRPHAFAPTRRRRASLNYFIMCLVC